MIFNYKTNFRVPLLMALCFITLILKANQPQQLNHLFVKSQTKTVEVDYNDFKAQQTDVYFNYSINLGMYGTYDLQLKSTNLFAPDFTKELQQKNNNLPLTYSGKIANEKDSHVALTVNQNYVSGYIYNGKSNIYFEPLQHFDPSAQVNQMVIYNEKDVLNKKFYCAHNHQPMSYKVEQQQQTAKNVACDEYIVEMVLVADYGMVRKYGSATAVRNRLSTVLNATQQNYNNVFNDPITFQLVDEYIATSAANDLWDAQETNADALLAAFAQSNFTDKVYDLASLWVSREIWRLEDGEREQKAGLAYDRGICKKGQKYNLISEDNSSLDYMETVLTHEIGHNFSAVHDPAGTEFIMSVGIASETWSPASIDKINSFYPNTNCLCSTDFVDLVAKSCVQFGFGGNTYRSVKVENVGTTTSSTTKVGLFLSEDSNINTNDYLVRTVNVNPLAPNEEITVQLLFGFDGLDLPGGTYYWGLIADAENNIEEGSEMNNRGCSSTITIDGVPSTMPDLIIENCNSVSISGNTLNTGSITLKNIGDKDAPGNLIRYYLTNQSEEYYIAASNFPAIDAGASFSRTISRNISQVQPPLPAGNYNLLIKADVTNAVVESNEANNDCLSTNIVFTVSYACKDATATNYNPNATHADNSICIYEPEEADLIIENCGSVTVSGNTINTGNIKVKNVGSSAAPASHVGVYLNIFTDQRLIAEIAFPELQSGASLSKSISINISNLDQSLRAGTYEISFWADKNRTVTESDENNNGCAASNNPTFTVTYGCKDESATNYNPTATYADNSVCVYEGCQQIDLQALYDFHDATNGESWTNKWNFSEDVSNWYGITLNSEGCVEKIDMFNNNLTGYLPATLNKLSALKRISLRFNKISGEIPASISELHQLESLTLSNNNLTGKIPASLGELPKLKYLYLGFNSLSGNIPVELSKLITLQKLDLYANDLGGNIPKQLGKLTNLSYLGLYQNKLTGSIPAELGNLVKLQKLNLMHNQLTGSIPSALGNLSNLKELKLYINQLEGEIPWQLGNLSKLEELTLFSNQLSGPIPLQFGKLSKLEELSLSNNKLIGTIPAELGDLTNLTNLSVDRNDLSGCFDEHLKNLCDANAYVNSRNNFDMEWDSFCATANDGVCQPTACVINDANTLLNLSFDFTLEGREGERPITYEGLTYNERGFLNTALDIRGTVYNKNAELQYPVTNNLNLNQGTIEAWVQHSWDGDAPVQHTLLQYGLTGGLLFFKDGGNYFRLLLNRWSPAGFPEINVGTSTQFWEPGEWKHVAATWGNGEIILYIDGEIADRNTYTQPIATIEDSYFNIGSDAGNGVWGGLVDQLRISNRVRTQSEIRSFMYACTGDRIKLSDSFDLTSYPNPFKESTQIQFDLPFDTPVNLRIYDASGKLMNTLLQEESLKKGKHIIRLNSATYAKGLYFCNLQYGTYQSSYKMIKAK